MSTAQQDSETIFDSSDSTDAELIERFVVARNQSAFAELVNRYSSVVLGVCRRTLHDTNDIDDVFQATFLVLVRDVGKLRKRTALASWLYGVAFRLSLRVARKKRQRRETALANETLISDDALGKLTRRHDQQLLDAELNALPERYRQSLVLRYMVGKSPSEVARELGTTVGTVEGLLKRGKQELRRRLLRRGISLGVALTAIQASQHVVHASQQTLIEATIQAGLAWNSGSNGTLSELVSDQALELASKEIFTMTAATKTSMIVGLTVGGLVAGLGGFAFLHGTSNGHVEAAGISSAISTAHTAGNLVQMAGFEADPLPTENQAVPESQAVNPPAQNTVLMKMPNQRRAGGQWDFRTRSPKEVRIEDELKLNSEVNFNDIPLKDALDYLSSTHQIDFRFELKQLEDVGISIDHVVTLHANEVSLKTVLRLLLDPIGLDYVVKNDSVIVTSTEDAQTNLETRIYNTSRANAASLRELAEAIVEIISPDRWHELDKDVNPRQKLDPNSPYKGTICIFEGKLLIRHTQRIHDEINDLLNLLDQATESSKPPVKR